MLLLDSNCVLIFNVGQKRGSKRELSFLLSRFSSFWNWSIISALANRTRLCVRVSKSRVVDHHSFLNHADFIRDIVVTLWVDIHCLVCVSMRPLIDEWGFLIDVNSVNFGLVLNLLSAEDWGSFYFGNQFDLAVVIEIIFFSCSFYIQLGLRVKRYSYMVFYQWFCVVSSSCIFLRNHSNFLVISFYRFKSVIVNNLLFYFIW